MNIFAPIDDVLKTVTTRSEIEILQKQALVAHRKIMDRINSRIAEIEGLKKSVSTPAENNDLIEQARNAQSQVELDKIWNAGYDFFLSVKREIFIRQGQLNAERDKAIAEKQAAEKEARFLNYLFTGK